ncbi:hypothetical protein LTR49_025369 [Elasticomyces elasticus]|nr:hypothetical protein LTR49_025369 [Elasticomyces elasticus]
MASPSLEGIPPELRLEIYRLLVLNDTCTLRHGRLFHPLIHSSPLFATEVQPVLEVCVRTVQIDVWDFDFHAGCELLDAFEGERLHIIVILHLHGGLLLKGHTLFTWLNRSETKKSAITVHYRAQLGHTLDPANARMAIDLLLEEIAEAGQKDELDLGSTIGGIHVCDAIAVAGNVMAKPSWHDSVDTVRKILRARGADVARLKDVRKTRYGTLRELHGDDVVNTAVNTEMMRKLGGARGLRVSAATGRRRSWREGVTATAVRMRSERGWECGRMNKLAGIHRDGVVGAHRVQGCPGCAKGELNGDD